jgi:predicted AAA+ superfamily ATPase
VRDLLALLELLASGRPDPTAVAGTFGQLWEELAVEGGDLLPDAWQSCLVGRLLDDENPFSLGAENGRIAPAIMEQTRRDLRTLQRLFELDARVLLGLVEAAVPELEGAWALWQYPELNPSRHREPRRALARKLAVAGDWADLAETLAEHYAVHGAGLFGCYRAFRWDRRLRAVPCPDQVHLEGLVGYEREREPLIKNTKRLLTGLPSHHVLLYGLPGTGKSSTVKALLNEYADRGLRLVELAKEDLKELPAVFGSLRGRAPRFILFIDDLSFEEQEVEYKALKALLEGSVEEPPENVRLYATSNRRNLIRERFSDRAEGGADDVHARDTMQEKFSLAARFGLRITFPSPDRERYFEIVAGLVRERGIEISEGELRERALRWDRWHGGRSGRTARQLVDELEAELSGVR